MSTPPIMPNGKSGYISKWVNYMKGFRQRFFVLDRGVLSYYRRPEEMDTACRGTLVLKGATFTTEGRVNFTISSAGSKGQQFFLKARNERERQEWLLALELSKQYALQHQAEYDALVGGILAGSTPAKSGSRGTSDNGRDGGDVFGDAVSDSDGEEMVDAASHPPETPTSGNGTAPTAESIEARGRAVRQAQAELDECVSELGDDGAAVNQAAAVLATRTNALHAELVAQNWHTTQALRESEQNCRLLQSQLEVLSMAHRTLELKSGTAATTALPTAGKTHSPKGAPQTQTQTQTGAASAGRNAAATADHHHEEFFDAEDEFADARDTDFPPSDTSAGLVDAQRRPSPPQASMAARKQSGGTGGAFAT